MTLIAASRSCMRTAMLYRGMSIVILSMVCVWSLPSFALGSINDYFMESWTSDDGLPHNSVNAIAQTDDGYLWFATWEGVARFNGLKFELYGRSPKTGIIDAGTRALVADDNNRLWVGGARGGLTLRQGYDWYPQPPAPSLVNHILIDQDSNQWIAVEGKGVYLRLNNTEQADQLILDKSASRIVQSARYGIVAVANDGIYQLTSEGAQALPVPEVLKGAYFYYVSVSVTGDLLVGSSQGAWRYRNGEFSPLSNQLQQTSVTVVQERQQGVVWLGTISQGLGRLTDKGLEFLDEASGLPNNRVISFLQDNEGSIWIGTNGGVMRLRKAPFVSVTEEDGLRGNFVRTVLPLDDGRILAGSSQGLSILEGGKAHALSAPAANQPVLSLLQSSTGGVWVGTQARGVYQLRDDIMLQRYTTKDGLPTDEVRALHKDQHNNLWIGTTEGVALVDPQGNVKTFDRRNSGLPDDYIMAFTEDTAGRIWIGTAVGLAYYQNDVITAVDLRDYEGAEYVFGFLLDNHYLWITTDRGLIRYDTETGHIGLVGKPSGLPIDKLFQVVYDGLGSLWLTSNRGIWKLSYAEAHAVADGKESTIHFEHFDKADGMGSSQANGGSNPTAAVTGDGQLVFATAHGVSLIYPNSIKQLYKYRLPVVVESIQYDGKTVNPAENISVAPDVNRVRFTYAGLGYVMPKRLQYRTKLVGYEDEWTYRGNQTIAEYTNLPPGDYRFILAARFPYGTWRQGEFAYEFRVEPSIWQQPMVRLGLIMLAILLFGGAFYWRINWLKRRQAYLTEQVALQTRELKQQSDLYERLSNEDALTGLFNRRAFDMQLRSEFYLANDCLVVAILDIDFFKQVNDQYSHLVGDEVIKGVAKQLNDALQAPDIAARWGGEEFTLLLHGSEAKALQMCQDIKTKITSQRFSSQGQEFAITVSIGLAEARASEDYQEIIKKADKALYAAKENGRNRIECYSENL